MAFPYHDLRANLEDLERMGQLARVREPIDVGYRTNELATLESYVAGMNGPTLWLDNLLHYNTPDVPVILNVYGTRERMALALGAADEFEAKCRVSRILQSPGTWPDANIVARSQAPCKEVVIRDGDIDLRSQLPHVWFGDERQSYPNCNITVSRDPETGVMNASTYRFGLLDLDPEGKPYREDWQKAYMTTYAWWNPPYNDIGAHYRRAVNRGHSLELAIAYVPEPTVMAIGGGPSILMGTHKWDKYALAGAVRGRGLDVVRCETMDLYVPASAEYVVECELVVPTIEELDGPHGNFLGYYDPQFVLPLSRVKCITRREKPIWYNTYEMWPPFDHGYVGVTFCAIEILADLQRKLPQVKDVVVHGGTWLPFCVVQLSVDRAEKPFPYFGRHVIHAVWAAAGRFPRMMKYVVVVGPDIDPYDLNDVLIAMVTRTQPIKDFLFNEFGGALVLDPSAPKGAQGNTLVSEQVGIDATIKVPERDAEFPGVARPTRAQIDALAARIGHHFGRGGSGTRAVPDPRRRRYSSPRWRAAAWPAMAAQSCWTSNPGASTRCRFAGVRYCGRGIASGARSGPNPRATLDNEGSVRGPCACELRPVRAFPPPPRDRARHRDHPTSPH
jgi:4-hydroxy-3-polyprenylbenzoate decarboxylase